MILIFFSKQITRCSAKVAVDESKVDMSRKMTISGPLDQVLESFNYTFRAKNLDFELNFDHKRIKILFLERKILQVEAAINLVRQVFSKDSYDAGNPKHQNQSNSAMPMAPLVNVRLIINIKTHLVFKRKKISY